MNWIYLALGSAVFLGIYDVARKLSVDRNAVLPTMLCTTASAALFSLGLVLASRACPEWMQNLYLYIPPLSWQVHGWLLLKSVIVGSSWICTYIGVKHLPMTIAVPIRASGPLWTLIGALLVFGERFNLMQWAGLGVVLVSYYLFSLQGRKEGIYFTRNRWVYIIFAGTLLGALSGMYDKFLMHSVDNDGIPLVAPAVLAWFLIYLAILMVLLTGSLSLGSGDRLDYANFRWRWSMPMVGGFLILADWLYFQALSDPEALIGIVSALRRMSVIVSFVLGGLICCEVNRWRKGLILGGVLVGGALIVFSR